MPEPTIEMSALNPFPYYQYMRQHNPVHFDPRFGAWQVFRYAEVQQVLSDHSRFSSAIIGEGIGQKQPLGASIISVDPPRHRQLRNLVTQAFTPRSITQLSERISAIVDEQLTRVLPTGQMDIVQDLAYPLPVMVIAEMLGIPGEDRARFKHWSDVIVGASYSGRNPQAEMSRYFLKVIEERQKQPQDDLISALLVAQVDGEYLTELELLGFCVLLLVAGNETTTNLIGNAIWCFDEQPQLLEQMRATPELLPAAIEEVLRFRSPLQFMYRRAVQDTEMGGQLIRAGQAVIAWIGSANRDESQFEAPDTFDLSRPNPQRHLAFGYGIHFCLGAPLARLEARLALTALVERLPNLKRRREISLEATGSTLVYGLKHLPISFTQK